MHVDHVIVAGPQLLLRSGEPVCGDRQIGDRAVGPYADRPPHRYEIVGRIERLGARAAMKRGGEPVRWVVRGQHSNVMPLLDEALGKGLDVPRHAPRIGPRVGGQQRDAHEFEW